MTAPPRPRDPAWLLADWLEQGRSRQVLDWYREAPDRISGDDELTLLVATGAARSAEYPLAEALARRVQERAAPEADGSLHLKAANLLGGIAFERGRLDQAWAWFEQVLAGARERHDGQLEAQATNNMASIQHVRGQPDDAEHLYQSALARYRGIGNRRGMAEVHHNLSIVYREGGRRAEAAAASDRAIQLARDLGDRTLLGLALAGKAAVELESATEGTRETIRQSRTLATDLGDGLGEVEADRLEAEWLLRAGRPGEALAVAEQGRTRAKEMGTLIHRGQCAVVSAAAWSGVDDALLAQARRDEAELIFELLGAEGELRKARP
jgi:tetratricopeptide (TPR) repeat protein